MMTTPKAPRVLIIEDHQLLRELIIPMLREQLGFELIGAVGTVADGVAICSKERPDLVIIDWMLPDGRGFDVVRAISPKLPRTRWLFMSANEHGHLVREAVRLQVQGFVMKRGSLDTLRTAIREVAAGRKFYCPESSRLLVERLVDDGLTGPVELTERELDVLRAFALGENPKAIALALDMRVRTVQNHLGHIRDKTGFHEPAALVRYAIQRGLVEPP